MSSNWLFSNKDNIIPKDVQKIFELRWPEDFCWILKITSRLPRIYEHHRLQQIFVLVSRWLQISPNVSMAQTSEHWHLLCFQKDNKLVALIEIVKINNVACVAALRGRRGGGGGGGREGKQGLISYLPTPSPFTPATQAKQTWYL